MAKKSNPPVRDLTTWLSDLAFFPTDDKNNLWLAQYLFYAKKNSVRFLDPTKERIYRKLNKGQINAGEYKQIADPLTPMGGGGKAEYTAADWTTCPIDMHLFNQLIAKMDRVDQVNKVQVNEIDKFAKSQKQRDKDKIIFQRELTKLLNEVGSQLGLPPVRQDQTPFDYIKSLNKNKEQGDNAIDSVDSLLDFIRSQIHDNQDLVLYETYIYKGDIERAFELGIQHLLIAMNKWHLVSEKFKHDIKNFNRFCGAWELDEQSGRGIVKYYNPSDMFTSDFVQYNGDDIVHWYVEELMTFAEFFRLFGNTLTEDELKVVFELNKQQGGNHGMTWQGAKSAKGSNAKIKVGRFCCLTQDANNFADYSISMKKPMWEQKPLSWMPSKFTPNAKQAEQKIRVYNVWYSCYYIPPPDSKLSSNKMTDWAWQSRFIFNVHKEVDMYRYGVDHRYAKSPLVIYKDESRMSFTDIVEVFMPKIRTTWHKFQNCLVQDTQALIMSKSLLNGLLQAVDEGNKDETKDGEGSGGSGVDAGLEVWKQLKQGGQTFMNFYDNNGELIIDPTKLFVVVDTKHLDKAERLIKIMLEQYNLMVMALAQNDVSQGQAPKPRTAVEAINQSLDAVDKGTWYIEKMVRECLIMFAERCVQHILCMIKERKKYGFKQRWEEFSNVIGKAHVLMMEGIEDLEVEEIGMTINLEDTTFMQKYIIEMATKMADDGEVGKEVVGLVVNQARENWKYAYVLLNVFAKIKQKEIAAREALIHEQKMEEKQADMKTALATVKAKADGKDQNILTEGKVQAMINDALTRLKHQSQAELSDKRTQNKIVEDRNKAELDKEKSEPTSTP